MILAIRRGVGELISFILPRLCCGCGERIIEHDRIVCQPCLDSIPPLLEPVCVTCGCPDAKVLAPGKCANCLPGKTWFSRARGAAPFVGVAQLMVFRLKYHDRTEYARAMVPFMVAELRKKGPADDGLEADLEVGPMVVVPVPLHSARERQRGFNQATVLGELIARELGVEFKKRAVKRIRATETQTRLKKRARRKNVEGAFICRQPEVVAGKRVLLVDDVYTTGNTLNECARVLVEAGAESVECLAFARAVLD